MMKLKHETDASISKRCQLGIIEGKNIIALENQLPVIGSVQRPQDM